MRDETSRGRVVAEAKVHLYEGIRRVIRLPRQQVWSWPARFVGDDSGASWTMFILPEEPLEVCRWRKVRVSVLMEEAERFLVSGTRFIFTFQTDTTPPEIIGEGVIVSSQAVSSEVFVQIFGDPWHLF